MTPPRDLISLLQRTASQDRAAFRELYHATSAKLYGVILRILHRSDMADEVLQEVYVKIWERAADYDAARASPIAWMATIARNRAIDEARRKRAVSIEDHPEVMNFATDEESALQLAVRAEDGRRLQECLSRLEPDRRKMVILAYCDGLSRDELAAQFGQPVNTVKTWLRRALAVVRGCLES